MSDLNLCADCLSPLARVSLAHKERLHERITELEAELSNERKRHVLCEQTNFAVIKKAEAEVERLQTSLRLRLDALAQLRQAYDALSQPFNSVFGSPAGGGRESGDQRSIPSPAGDGTRVAPSKPAAADPAAPVASIGGAWHKHGDVVYPDCPECFRIQMDMARELAARKEPAGRKDGRRPQKESS